MSKGIFGGLFDFDGDGELDTFEQAAEFMLFNELMKDEKRRNATTATIMMMTEEREG